MINNNSKIGDIITFGNGKYKITNLYQLTDEHMKQYDLYHRNRVTLTKISGEGSDTLDFAVAE